MKNATLRGKPDAGNPHVRFDEGEVASVKPRRGSLLYKESLSKIGDKVREGCRRFWVCHLGAVGIAALLVLANHDCLAESDALNYTWGICWGALAGVFVQLLAEWRERPKLSCFVGPVAGLVGALGCAFWFAVDSESPRYSLWILLYGGTSLALLASSIAVLYQYADGRTLVSRLACTALGASGTASIFTLSLMLCLVAYSQLVSSVSGKVFLDVWASSWIILTTVGFFSFLPGRARDEELSNRAAAFLFWLLLPAALILLGILYLYIGKIVVRGSMPSGKLNWYGSIALAGYAFFWLALRDSTRRFFRLFVRWGWILLLPVLVAQIVGIVVRYQAYGLSTPRLAGMVTLSFGVCALVLAAFNKRAHFLFIFIAVLGLVFTVTPLNIIDVPVRNQEFRLRSVLERNGLLQNGKLNLVKKDIRLSEEDLRIIDGVWDYLLIKEKKSQGVLRPTVWYRSEKLVAWLATVEAECRNRKLHVHDLLGLLGVDASTIAKINHVGSSQGGYLHKRCTVSSELPIAGYTGLWQLDSYRLYVHQKNGRWSVDLTVPGYAADEKFDVTESVKRILSDNVMADDVKVDLKPANAIWELRPGLALAVCEISISCRAGEKISCIDLDKPALLTRPVPQK